MAQLPQTRFEATLTDFIMNELPLLSDHHRTVPKGVLTPDTPLFQDGFVDSLGLVYLLAFVEELLDISIPEEKIVMRNFRTVRAIWRAFAGPVEVAEGGRRAD